MSMSEDNQSSVVALPVEPSDNVAPVIKNEIPELEAKLLQEKPRVEGDPPPPKQETPELQSSFEEPVTDKDYPVVAPVDLSAPPTLARGSSVVVTKETTSSELKSFSLETVGALAGWTAKRVSITGQIFFERDADGRIETERPREALLAALEQEEDEDSDIEEDIVLKKNLTPVQGPQSSRNLIIPPAEKLSESDISGSDSSSKTPPSSTSTAATQPQQKETPFALSKEMLKQIKSIEGNERCADCGVGQPTWSSTGYGVVICMACAGNHRSLGTHLTVVKSLTLDNWTSDQLAYVLKGGNAKFKSFVKEGKQFHRYKVPDAETYRNNLKALVKGEEASAMDRGGGDEAVKFRETSKAGGAKFSLDETKDSTNCMICGVQFSVVVRKHYCRKCNRACCARCAPPANSKPLPQLGLGMTPMRHCSRCYRSPFIDWTSQGLSQVDMSKDPTKRNVGPNRKTVSEAKAPLSGLLDPTARRKTIGDALKTPKGVASVKRLDVTRNSTQSEAESRASSAANLPSPSNKEDSKRKTIASTLKTFMKRG